MNTLGRAVGALLAPLLALLLLSAGVEVWVRLAGVSRLVMPPPTEVYARLWTDRGLLFGEGALTLAEALGGLALGALVAAVLAAAMAGSRSLERLLMPVVLLVKVTPIVALAPLLIIWFGFGAAPKVLTCALIVFFPVLVNGITGLRSVNPRMLEFLQSVHASRREIFLKLRLPSALPYLLSAFRTAIPLSIIGAVIAEYFNPDRGLGRLIYLANNNLDTPGLFAGIIVLALIGVLLTGMLSLLEGRLLFWHESREGA
jgi:ABC-type nitrate/sulfonate/bicarbonate transport system permease component